MEQDKELIEYPVRFPIKVMGLADDAFAGTMFELVRGHVPELIETDIEQRASSGGKYLSLTVTVTATSREHLDGIYRALTGHPLVKYVL